MEENGVPGTRVDATRQNCDGREGSRDARGPFVWEVLVRTTQPTTQ